MNTNKMALTHPGIIHSGQQSFENTADYKKTIADMRGEIGDKYNLLFAVERNEFRKVILHLRKHIEVLIAINKISAGWNCI